MEEGKKSSRKKSAPAITAEQRENQLIALAVDKVEERMLTGKATSQEYIHFLKLASQKQQLELEKLKAENALLTAKKEALESARRTEEMYMKAIAAMRSYTGATDGSDDPKEVVLGID